MSTIGTVTARDGLELRTRHWPVTGIAWALLLLIHGIADHSGRYERTGMLLAASGIDAVVMGTGDITKAHGPDEWVMLDELHRARDLFRTVFAER